MPALCSQVDCTLGGLDPGSSGSQKSVTSRLSASGFLLHIPFSTLHQSQDTKTLPSTRKPPPQPGQKPAWRVYEFRAKLELLHTGSLTWVTWPTGRVQPREGRALRALAAPPLVAGPRVLFHKKRRSEDPFLGNHLSDVTWAS